MFTFMKDLWNNVLHAHKTKVDLFGLNARWHSCPAILNTVAKMDMTVPPNYVPYNAARSRLLAYNVRGEEDS